jgi:hypothetical protein
VICFWNAISVAYDVIEFVFSFQLILDVFTSNLGLWSLTFLTLWFCGLGFRV